MQIQLGLLLDRACPDTLTSQIVSQIRDAIRHGRIAPGMRLPSSRRLSEQLGVGRNTITRAYETLLMESYVEARPASGMFAARIEPHAAPVPPAARPRSAPPGRGHLSIDFAPGAANASLFPLKAWRRHLQASLARGGANGLARAVDPFGVPALRAAIAAHLAAARGLVTDADRIVIVSGTGEALSLAARLLVTPGARAAIESPGSRRAAELFAGSGADLLGVAVDELGLRTDDLPDGKVTLLHVTPSHQYPTGHTLAPGRRAALVAWARSVGCTIVEEDVGCELRYAGGAPPAIAAMAPDCTLYIGGFAQSLGAGLGLGYAVIPPALLDAAYALKTLAGASVPWLEQAVLADMMQAGTFAAHLTRMRIAYRERRDQLLVSLQRHFGEVDISGAEGGMHLVWHLPPGVPDAATIAALSRRARVGVYPTALGEVFETMPGLLGRRGLMLGYAALTSRQIEQGIARLSDAVDDALDLHRIGLGDLLTHRQGAPRPLAGRGRLAPKPAPRFRQNPALPVPPAPPARSGPATAGGPGAAMPAVTALYRYPIKGFSAQRLETVRLGAGAPFPFDRVFAFARPGVGINPEEPRWAKKGLFVMLMLDEALARVRTHLDPDTLRLTVHEGERPVLSADLADGDARRRAEAFVHGLVPSLHAPPRLVRANTGGHFMDKPDSVVSLINLATLRSLAEKWGVPLDPLRFRANIYIDGAAPWEEFDWVGSDIRLGGALFHVDRRNGRCGATNVDPATGRRDLDIPRSLRALFGHKDLGVYLVARQDATLRVGDRLELPRQMVRAPVLAAAAPPPTRAFICSGCFYIYDEARGVPAAGIGPGCRFADLPASWPCPDCGTDKGRFAPHLSR